MSSAIARVSQVLRSPITVLATALISMAALSVSWQANAIATKEAQIRAELIAEEAQVRTELIEAQNRRLQDAFCGLVEPFGNTGNPATPSGQQIQASFRNAASELQCTPDPTDGR